MRTALVERQSPNKRRKAGKDVAEPAIRRALHDMLPAVKLMGAEVLVVHAVVPRADAPPRMKPHIQNAIATYWSGSQRHTSGTCRCSRSAARQRWMRRQQISRLQLRAYPFVTPNGRLSGRAAVATAPASAIIRLSWYPPCKTQRSAATLSKC